MNLGRFGRGSFRPGSFRPGSFRPYLGVSPFGLFRWDVLAVSRFGRGSFRPVLILVQNPLIFVVNFFLNKYARTY